MEFSWKETQFQFDNKEVMAECLVQRNINQEKPLATVFYCFTKENKVNVKFLDDESNERKGGAICKIDKLKIFLSYVADPDFESGV